MGFLDNLENSLKSLESQEERDPNAAVKRQDERVRALAIAPWAAQLKDSKFTKDLFDKAAVAGHRRRTKIYMAWVDTTLRLEARGHVLTLKPTTAGIVSEYINSAGEETTEAVDLNEAPDGLLERWLEASQIGTEGIRKT